MSNLSSDPVRRIQDSAVALIAASSSMPIKAQVRQHLTGGYFSAIVPVMSALRSRQREHLAVQLSETKTELKGTREENCPLQRVLLSLARKKAKGGKA
ncbi:hypothetical protein [Yersinia bercovieri]|uniref:hypothetical protein n=1 Tax=Yersinia bercovieri TaxID=634 RepID=UPI0011A64147|nr:hypothetical protein [Yersinia bercovieri]